MKILYFSTARIAANCGAEELALGNAVSADDVWATLVEKHPALAAVRANARLSRNGEYADAATLFYADDEVAVIPPVSGG